jgi:tRNA pseudouridine38-40 synthase
MEKNILLTIEYDGTNFHGWQKQPERRTVQGELERVLSVVCGQEIKIDGTSRTDAGVHAFGQCASFKGNIKIPADKLIIAANNLLSGGKNAIGPKGDVRITGAEEKPPEFHARFDAKGKKYIYMISNESEVDIFKRNYLYQIVKPLNTCAMEEAAEYIKGTKDFKSFQASGGEEKKTTVRTIYDLKVIKKQGVICGMQPELHIEVSGDGFLYNMVRIITGTLVDVGLGKLSPKAIPAIIESKDRQSAGHTAPPQGLYLAEVYYDVI